MAFLLLSTPAKIKKPSRLTEMALKSSVLVWFTP
jgi:hypothetical protein